jgi:hypothetical protein
VNVSRCLKYVSHYHEIDADFPTQGFVVLYFVQAKESGDQGVRVQYQVIIVILEDISQLVELRTGYSFEHEILIGRVVEEAATLSGRRLLLET